METEVKRATVVGGGSFGTALALVLARKGAVVSVWVRDVAQADAVNAARENKKYLEGTQLPENLSFTSDIHDAVRGSEIVIMAIPTQFIRPFLESNRSTFPVGVPIVQSAKGIELGTLQNPYQIMLEELPGKYSKYICVLAGPSFAKEIAKGLATNVTIAAADPALVAKVQGQMSCRQAAFRCYGSDDVMGCEVAGACKNVLAICSGASTGIGMGLNARAGLICRGLAEMSALAEALGSNCNSMAGLAGVGDLLLTCSSEMSRNFSVGLRVARGETVADINASMSSVAEGVATAKSLHDLAQQLGVTMPLCEQTYQVLYSGKTVRDALSYLMERPLGMESPKEFSSAQRKAFATPLTPGA